MTQYQTKDGDTVDYVAYKFYGNTKNEIVEQIYELNPHLFDHPPLLPENLIIELPKKKVSTTVSNKKVKLWD